MNTQICETSPIQDQGCQRLPKFFDNMDYITIKKLLYIIQAQFFLSAGNCPQ